MWQLNIQGFNVCFKGKIIELNVAPSMFRVIFMFFVNLRGHVVMIKDESLGEYAQSLENLAS